MRQCSACSVDYHHNPDVRVLFAAACDHQVCELCVKRLWRGQARRRCPVCDEELRAEDFSEQSREDRQVESEVKVRRQICEIFCKSQEDFPSVDAYDEYLMQREDTIYKLVNPASQEQVKETWREIERYREENATQILRAQQAAPRKKLQKIRGIIEAEGGFASTVNAEWGERLAAGSEAHPFQARYRELLAGGPGTALPGGRCAEEMSPLAPQPMHGEHGGADVARQMSGGGQAPDTCASKARHFFFADLVAAARVATAAA